MFRPRRHGAWLEVWQAGDRRYPLVPIPKQAASFCRYRHIHHLTSLFEKDESNRWWTKVRKPVHPTIQPEGMYVHPGEQELYDWVDSGLGQLHKH
jgi:hypothetical protein